GPPPRGAGGRGRGPGRDAGANRRLRRRGAGRPPPARRLDRRRAAAPGRRRRRMIRVLLVDDQSLLRMGFRMILDAEPDIEVAGAAAPGATGVSLTPALRADVGLMDVGMPGMNGTRAPAAITAAAPASKILILTTFDLDEYVFAGLKAGASGFLLKDAPPADLLTAIRTVAGGEAVLAPTATRRLLDQFVPLPPPPGHHPAP